MKGLKNIADNQRTKLIALENENDYLKDEIDKLECELLKKIEETNEEENYRNLLSELFQEGIIDAEGKLKKHNN